MEVTNKTRAGHVTRTVDEQKNIGLITTPSQSFENGKALDRSTENTI